MDVLVEFAKNETPTDEQWDPSFDAILNKIADENELDCTWSLALPLIRFKLRKVITSAAVEDIITALNLFDTSPPFTVQRLCELVQRPTEHHKTELKVIRTKSLY
ncbi:hypothetical protein BC829DRAFT_236531 [Chytridium lagenaria]|nr:hypothetical protein BC829DRAFT_236531 [Chytridium lagenaria]